MHGLWKWTLNALNMSIFFDKYIVGVHPDIVGYIWMHTKFWVTKDFFMAYVKRKNVAWKHILEQQNYAFHISHQFFWNLCASIKCQDIYTRIFFQNITFGNVCIYTYEPKWISISFFWFVWLTIFFTSYQKLT
jgi:hypothetical protein